jgi:hypothetical protein
MTRIDLDRPRMHRLPRRRAFELAGGATAFTFLQRKAHGFPAPEHYVDHLAAERIADRDPARLPILIDAQTHAWWRSGGIRQMSERGEHLLKSLAEPTGTPRGSTIRI